jgi:hypothetical protein
MSSGTCLIIRPANFGTRVQQSRFPKFVIDISSGVRHFFLCALRVRSLCGLVRRCAVLCGVVRCCAVLCVFFCEADGSTPTYLRPLPTSLPTFALQIHESCIPILPYINLF